MFWYVEGGEDRDRIEEDILEKDPHAVIVSLIIDGTGGWFYEETEAVVWPVQPAVGDVFRGCGFKEGETRDDLYRGKWKVIGRSFGFTGSPMTHRPPALRLHVEPVGEMEKVE